MRLLTRRRDIVCREAVELVTDYLEGKLSRRDTRAFEAHLGACDGCEEYVRQIKATIEILGSVQPEDLAPETRQGLVELYRQFRGEHN
ncbi:MAG: zf-HC2 domain-containing protein [Acidimicrobiales bacterium]|jgi:anti-sigma factor RsiW